MILPSLGSHMGLPLPKPPQNRCCLWNQNSAIIHGIEPLRRLTPPPRPFRGGNFVYRVCHNRFSPLKGYSPIRGNVCDSRQKGARFRRKRCHEVTEGFQSTNNNLPVCFLLGHSDKLFVNLNLSFAKQKTAITSLLGHTTAGVYCVAQTFRLMLLGLPPDMVHGALSHRTRRRMTQ